MNTPFLPPEDLPMQSTTDFGLQRRLDEIIGQHFYESCDCSLQTLLSQCGWYLTSSLNVLTLVITCPDHSTNLRILKRVAILGYYLQNFTERGKIQIYPPVGEGTSLIIPVRKRQIYQDSL
ncbi:hypothetical protein [Cyanobacterium sp. uoEpiScrs1]|uniref:hypothetical protein n=1 Tax=Cyanobacterium sp. uoEpiScrs1 TaxID=2976343 RepID=UPI00226AFBB3|nr:hypothetical protein [Cyanobacterium sp. uoEpiScrs1]